MSSAPNLAERIKHTAEELPYDKQAEIYDFAKFLKQSAKPAAAKRRNKKGSILNLAGIGASGVGDISVNHDKYLYD